MDLEYVALADVLCHIVDNRGKTCPTAEHGLPLIATNCIRNDQLYPNHEKVRYVDDATYQTWFRGHPDPGDLIFVTKGSPGRVCMTPEPVNFCIAQDMVAIRADKDKIHPAFLLAVLRSPQVQQQIENMHVGTMIPHFKKGDFDKLLLPMPNRAIQEFIGDAYYLLSRNIDLNRRMNETLEAMAMAIFKSWFVDFDPVRAKMDGREPSGMDEATAALFPNSLVGSSVGPIPVGWNVMKIGDLVDIKHGFAFKGEFIRTEATPNVLLTPGNFAIGGGFKPDKLKYYDGPVPDAYVLEEGELIVTMTDLSKMGDTLGYPAIVPRTPGIRYLHNQRLGRLQLKMDSLVGVEFLRRIFCLPTYRHHVLGSASGSTVKHTSPDRIRAFEFPCPGFQVANVFEQFSSSLHTRHVANMNESNALVSLRDTLLPKLLSGEIRVGQAEKLVAEAV